MPCEYGKVEANVYFRKLTLPKQSRIPYEVNQTDTRQPESRDLETNRLKNRDHSCSNHSLRLDSCDPGPQLFRNRYKILTPLYNEHIDTAATMDPNLSL